MVWAKYSLFEALDPLGVEVPFTYLVMPSTGAPSRDARLCPKSAQGGCGPEISTGRNSQELRAFFRAPNNSTRFVAILCKIVEFV